ncbi:hypothetical protein Tco_1339834, partial [Tanacetum coccineum]
VSAKKDPLTFHELMATPIDFSKFAKNRLKLDKITKADLVGLVYELLKGTCQSSIELESNMEECYKALTDQLDCCRILLQQRYGILEIYRLGKKVYYVNYKDKGCKV